MLFTPWTTSSPKPAKPRLAYEDRDAYGSTMPVGKYPKSAAGCGEANGRLPVALAFF